VICEDCDQIMVEVRRDQQAILRGRSVILHGAIAYQCRCGESSTYPKVGRLVQLMAVHPEKRSFYWNNQTKEWSIGANDHLGARTCHA
jgi:hypothetical protein